MKYSKSCDYIRKKKSRKEEVKIQVFVRIRPFLKNEKKRLLKEINENIIICKYIINLYLILIQFKVKTIPLNSSSIKFSK